MPDTTDARPNPNLTGLPDDLVRRHDVLAMLEESTEPIYFESHLRQLRELSRAKASSVQTTEAVDIVNAVGALNATLNTSLTVQLKVHFHRGSESMVLDQVTELSAIVTTGQTLARS